MKAILIILALTSNFCFLCCNNEVRFGQQPPLISGNECNFLLVSDAFSTRSKLSCAEQCAIKKDVCFSFSYNVETTSCRLHTNVITDITSCVTSHFTVQYHRRVDETLWPQGSYGLMKTIGGCPGELTIWIEGSLTQDTEGTNVVMDISTAHDLAGSVATSDITTAFCIKHQALDTLHLTRPSWPMGSYCILKYGDCPQGLSPGYITWDDEDVTNTNVVNGVLPDGTYNNDTTTIYYCCRNDSPSSTPVVLPVTAPFVLFKKGGVCQTVQGMTVVEEWIIWETEGVDNNDEFGGHYPDIERITTDLGIKLFFCYYS